jgi:UDP:flavonoid glycosyltransferase YjiC (YdhE family)
MLSLNAAELDFPHEQMDGFRYSGPLIDPRRIEGEQSSSEEDYKRLSGLLDRRSSGQCEALIYCSFGAWHRGDDRRFLKEVIEGVARQHSWDLILGLGNRVSSVDLGPVPPNVHLFEWAPQLEVLGRADVAIHHGGISSVNECVLARVPMVLYPFDFMDQPGNSARVEFHGLGEVGDRKTERGNDIALRVARVLDDPSYGRNLDEMAVSFERYLSANVAVAEVERYLGSF